MKKAIVTSAAISAVFALVAGCGAKTDDPGVMDGETDFAPVVQVPADVDYSEWPYTPQLSGDLGQGQQSAMFLVQAGGQTSDELLLDSAERAATVVTGLKIMTGEADCDQLVADLQAIEDARQALRELEEARRAAHVVTGLNILIGMADSSQLAADMADIEEARQTVLRGIGLAAEDR